MTSNIRRCELLLDELLSISPGCAAGSVGMNFRGELVVVDDPIDHFVAHARPFVSGNGCGGVLEHMLYPERIYWNSRTFGS